MYFFLSRQKHEISSTPTATNCIPKKRRPIKNVIVVVKNSWFFLGVKMPYINLKVGGKLTDEQKKEIIAQFTKTLETVASKPASSTYIVIDEVSRDLWSVGGKLLSEND